MDEEIKVESLGDIDLENITLEEAKDVLKKFLEREELLKKKVEEMNAYVTDKQAEIDSFKDKWVRCAADFENYKKRNLDVRRNAFDEGKTEVITKILSVGDNLERALKLELDEKTREGIEMITRNFKETLANLNVLAIESDGIKFDPNVHNCVMQEENEDESLSGLVKDEFVKGYKLGDKVIRYSSVRVYK